MKSLDLGHVMAIALGVFVAANILTPAFGQQVRDIVAGN